MACAICSCSSAIFVKPFFRKPFARAQCHSADSSLGFSGLSSVDIGCPPEKVGAGIRRAGRDPVNGGAQIATINADGSGFRKITSGANNNGFPSYLPDGERIVYRTMGLEGDGLRIMNLKDGTVTRLTADYDNFPVWSPRGDLIAFVRRLDGDNFEVFTIRPDGTGLRRLTNSKGNDAHPAWSPDGEKIVFSSTRMGSRTKRHILSRRNPTATCS
jgi:Tol biopolymer transport system component